MNRTCTAQHFSSRTLLERTGSQLRLLTTLLPRHAIDFAIFISCLQALMLWAVLEIVPPNNGNGTAMSVLAWYT